MVKGEKKTFVAHHPGSMKVLGTYTGRIPSQAAKKAAAAGNTDFILRETGTKKGKQFKGGVKHLTTPKVVMIKGKEVKYTKQPHAKYVKMVDMSGHTVKDA
jgi:hypothetical protein